MSAPVPSPDLQEALEWAERYRGTHSTHFRDAIILADEIYRLRAQLADETTRRRDLAVELTGTWGDQCAAMAAVVREVGRIVNIDRQFDAWTEFRASGWLPTIELTEDSEHA